MYTGRLLNRLSLLPQEIPHVISQGEERVGRPGSLGPNGIAVPQGPEGGPEDWVDTVGISNSFPKRESEM